MIEFFGNFGVFVVVFVVGFLLALITMDTLRNLTRLHYISGKPNNYHGHPT